MMNDMTDIKIDDALDLRGVPCPMNSAKTIVQLEIMDTDEVLEVLLDDGEPIENVPGSIEEEFYEIINKENVDNNYWKILIKVL